jgi:hypothetical protein
MAAIELATNAVRRALAAEGRFTEITCLAGALCTTLLAATGITSKSLRAVMTGLLHAPYTPGQMTYDLGRLRLTGLISRIEHTNHYALTAEGILAAIFYTRVHNGCSAPARRRPAPGTRRAQARSARHRPAR